MSINNLPFYELNMNNDDLFKSFKRRRFNKIHHLIKYYLSLRCCKHNVKLRNINGLNDNEIIKLINFYYFGDINSPEYQERYDL